MEGQEGIPPPRTTNPTPSAKPPGLEQESEKPGTSAQKTTPGETGPSSTKRQRPNPLREEASSTKFGSAQHPRNRTVWERLCKATDINTGQLRGSVGTPDKPLLTYEEAVRQRGTDRDLVLWVGPDIIPAGEE